MGVGKTIQALALSYLYKDEWPLLIVAPSTLKLYWKDEILKWFPSIDEQSIYIVASKSKHGIFPKGKQIYILSYDLAKNITIELGKQSFKVAIADEVHYLKSRSSKRSEALVPILLDCNRVMILSGTPILSRPVEIFNACLIIRPDIFKPLFKEFGHRYCDPKLNPFSKTLEYKGATNVEELHFLLSSLFMIRRYKADVLSQLPAKMRQKIPIEADAKISKRIEKILSNVSKDDIDSQLNNTIMAPDSSITQAYTLTGEAKIKGIVNFIENLIKSDTKFIVFAHHIKVMDAIEVFVKGEGVSYIRIDGSTDLKERHKLIGKFQEVREFSVAILSITACSQGLTLTASSTVVFAELNWTPAIMEQAEDRVHRVGQKSSVTIYYLYSESTLDSFIMRKLDRKFDLLNKTLNGFSTSAKFEPIDMGAVIKTECAKSEVKEECDYTKFSTNSCKQKISDYFPVATKLHSNPKAKPLNTVEIDKMVNNKIETEITDDDLLKLLEEDQPLIMKESDAKSDSKPLDEVETPIGKREIVPVLKAMSLVKLEDTKAIDKPAQEKKVATSVNHGKRKYGDLTRVSFTKNSKIRMYLLFHKCITIKQKIVE